VAERASGAAGFTLVELLAALLVLGLAAMAVGTVLASSTRYASASEARQNLANRAQHEAERLASLDYTALAHAALPAAGANSTSNPLYWYDTTAHTYRWDRTTAGSSTAEALAVSAAGTVAYQQSWSDGRSSGSLYSFVTWVTDGKCGAGCPSSQNYKRITVAATLASGGPPVAPVYVSSIVADPHAVPAGRVTNGNANPLSDPTITCRDASGATVSCTASVGSSDVNEWYLTDTKATSPYAPPTVSHTTHATVAPSGTCTTSVTTGCPIPDLLNTTGPPASTPSPPLLDFSTDQTASGYPGGRVIKRDVACSATPTATDNTKGVEWATAPLTSAMLLTGSGGMTLNSQTAAGVTASVTLCLGIYESGSITNLISTPPVRLGVVSYTVAQWPTAPTPISFSFDFLTGSTVTVASGHRLIVRLWLAATSGSDVAIMYDHPDYASVLQLNSQ
jgi:prepilin-type N-terminal cleavage/methylation domain-containing protein